MHDTFLLPNTLFFLILWFLGLAFFYYMIKAAVANGVRQANEGLIESVKEIERSATEMKKRE